MDTPFVHGQETKPEAGPSTNQGMATNSPNEICPIVNSATGADDYGQTISPMWQQHVNASSATQRTGQAREQNYPHYPVDPRFPNHPSETARTRTGPFFWGHHQLEMATVSIKENEPFSRSVAQLEKTPAMARLAASWFAILPQRRTLSGTSETKAMAALSWPSSAQLRQHPKML